MKTRRVVITGLGCVSSLGDSVAELWDGMKVGRSGLQRLERYAHFSASVFAPVKTNTWKFVEDVEPAVRPKMTRAMHMLFGAVREALIHSQLRTRTREMHIGLIAATSANYHAEIIGGEVEGKPEELLQYYFARSADAEIDWKRFFQQYQYPPNNLLRHTANLLTCVPAMHFGLTGINETTHSACAAGTHAVGAAFRAIKHGYADVVLAGAADAMVDWVGISALGRLGVLSSHTDPSNACCPFDLRRNGMVVGEGAGILAVESLESAERRGAHVLAEILGFGSTANAYRITDSPVDGKSASEAIRGAVCEAGIDPSEIDAVSAHGTSTAQNDIAETNALKRALGEVATKVPTMAPKALLGHALSAAGAIELVAATRVLQTGFLPGAPSYQERDPDCDLSIVGKAPVEKSVRHLLKNSFGFGGQNGSLVLKQWPVSAASAGGNS
jgi:3-oxoacyl-[acyl-carrier-protein] synthase II